MWITYKKMPKKKKYEISKALISKLINVATRVSTVRDLAAKVDLPYHLVYKLVREHDIQFLDKNKEVVDRALEERAKNPNLSISDLAEIMGVNYHTLHTILRRHGDLPDKGLPFVRGQRSLQWAEQVKQLASQGKTQTEIAKELGITKQYVHLLRTQNHIDVRITNNSSETRKKSREVVRLLKDGFTPYRIHIHTGYSKNFVYKVVGHYKSTGKAYLEKVQED